MAAVELAKAMGALVIAVLVVGIYPAVISDVFSDGVAPIVRSLEAAHASLR